MSADDPAMPASEPDPATACPGVLSVHFGHSANCSSVGSIVDFLFLSGAASAAVIAAVAVLLRRAPEEGADDGEGAAAGREEAGDAPE